MSDLDGEARHITEAEYRDWLGRAMPMLAAELTAALPQEVQDAGLRFEWTADEPPSAWPAASSPSPAG